MMANREPLFTPAAFDLMEAFSHDPHASFYTEHREELRERIDRPFRVLMANAAAKFPGIMRARLETRHNLFSRWLKNDFGRGGAWDHCWAAYYPLGGRRTVELQLAVWLDRSLLQISFYIGDYAPQRQALFARACGRYFNELYDAVPPLLAGYPAVLASDWDLQWGDDGRPRTDHPLEWEEWLADPARGMFCVRVPYARAEAETLTLDDLTERVAQIHSAYFPLALCAMDENPLALIRAFAGEETA
jgi:hypothetical protein